MKIYRTNLRNNPISLDLVSTRREARITQTFSGYDLWIETNYIHDRESDLIDNYLWFGSYDTLREAIKDASHLLRRIKWFEDGKPRKWS